MAIVTVVTPQWYQEVISSYAGDQRITALLEKLTVRQEEVERYTLKGRNDEVPGLYSDRGQG